LFLRTDLRSRQTDEKLFIGCGGNRDGLESIATKAMKKLISGYGVLAVLLCTSCAAVFRGSQQPVHVDSTPGGADIQEQDRVLGQTPTTLQLSRQYSTNMLRISKLGYEDASPFKVVW
jgi:PEGA domain